MTSQPQLNLTEEFQRIEEMKTCIILRRKSILATERSHSQSNSFDGLRVDVTSATAYAQLLQAQISLLAHQKQTGPQPQ